MQAGANKNNNQRIFNSLINDLKRPLVLIARQAELGDDDDDINVRSIQQTAENMLKLIDSYLLMSQSEYGQQLLPVRPLGVGSVIYSVAEDIRPIARKANIDLVLNINEAPVMANPEGLKAAIWCLSDMVVSRVLSKQDNGMVEISAKKLSGKVRVSVLSKSIKIKNSDIAKAKNSLGKTHMALNFASNDSGIRLAIASLIGESLGTNLIAVRDKHMQGVGFNLSLSRQLQLI